MTHRNALIVALTVLFSGCASDINRVTAARYAGGCKEFQWGLEWWKARRACGRAVINAELGRVPEIAIAPLWYEYGRTSGAICDYKEARRGLEKALEIDQKYGGPTFMSLLELARLHLDQGKFEEAVEFFERFDAAVPRDRAVKEDPIGYADALKEYAEALRRTGMESKARELSSQASQLENANSHRVSRTDRTPYGKYCDQKS